MPLDHLDYPSVEPEQVVYEAFGALGRGPIHYVDGSEPSARMIQQLPRAEAVIAVSQAMEQVPNTPMGMYFKVVNLAILNMRYERIAFNRASGLLEVSSVRSA